jgi:hypothetical protein
MHAHFSCGKGYLTMGSAKVKSLAHFFQEFRGWPVLDGLVAVVLL